MKKSISNNKGKSKSMENIISEKIKSNDSVPSMTIKNSVNIDRSNESWNKFNFIENMTIFENDYFNENNEKVKKNQEMYINLFNNNENGLLTNNLEFLMNEIKSLEIKTQELSHKNITTDVQIVTDDCTNLNNIDKQLDINFNESFNLLSFHNTSEIKVNPDISSISKNMSKNIAHQEKTKFKRKSNKGSKENLFKKVNIYSCVNIYKGKKKIQEHLDDKRVLSKDEIKGERLKKNYGLNISLSSMKHESPSSRLNQNISVDNKEKNIRINLF